MSKFLSLFQKNSQEAAKRIKDKYAKIRQNKAKSKKLLNLIKEIKYSKT